MKVISLVKQRLPITSGRLYGLAASLVRLAQLRGCEFHQKEKTTATRAYSAPGDRVRGKAICFQ